MFLDFNKIKEITFGVQNVVEKGGMVEFRRFTQNQAKCYLDIGRNDHYLKTGSPAGVRFSFSTDAEQISFTYIPTYGSGRIFGKMDVLEDDELTGHYVLPFCENKFVHTFKKGQKKVEVYFPWSCQMRISEVELKGATFVKGEKRKQKSLAFGDSITQGYDSECPSNSYVSLMSKVFDSDVIDMGIGGDVHFAPIIRNMEVLPADYITVAYGTNDWRLVNYIDFVKCVEEFYKELIEKYPTTKIFAILPLWRVCNNIKVNDDGKTLDDYREKIKEIVSKYKNVVVINGKNLITHAPELFEDKVLHPNDAGFKEYATNLVNEMKKYL